MALRSDAPASRHRLVLPRSDATTALIAFPPTPPDSDPSIESVPQALSAVKA